MTRGPRAHTWIAGGVVGVLVAGGAAAAMGGRPDPGGIPTSTSVTFVADDGSTCTASIQPVVRTGDPAAWAIAHSHLATVDPIGDLALLIDDGPPEARELDALISRLSRRTEGEIFRRIGSRVAVTLLVEFSCQAAPITGDADAAPPIVGDDFGREPTPVAGRPPDAVGFFRASTGQICEIQMKVDPDGGNGATDDDGAVAARAYLASVDFTLVDYSSALRDLADFWPADHERGEIEAGALTQTLTRQAHSAFDTTNPSWLPIIVTSWARCDPAPTG